MKEKYENLLKIFVGNDEFRKWMNVPFEFGEMAVATNAVSLVCFPKSNVNKLEPCTENINVISILENAAPLRIKLTLADLQDCLIKAPKANGKVPLFEAIKCDACKGEGVVEFTFYHKSRSYETTDECPICDSEGQIAKSISFPVLVRDNIINGGNVQKLIDVCELMGRDEIYLTRQSPINKAANHFQLDDITIVIMPMDENQVDYKEVLKLSN